MIIDTALDTLRLSRVEDAGLNASAPPQQLWLDGWLVRFCPGSARRSRCINAVAEGRSPVQDRLARCESLYRDAGLPLLLRITPFSLPRGLDRLLNDQRMNRIDETRVMVLSNLDTQPIASIAHDLAIEPVGRSVFARHIGRLRGSTLAQCQAHADRLEQSPVPFNGFVMKDDSGQVIACGQYAIEAELVGLYDVFTDRLHRRQGLAASVCRQLLHRARSHGAQTAYLQVAADNEVARRVYQRIGFSDGYSYHYRAPAPAGDSSPSDSSTPK